MAGTARSSVDSLTRASAELSALLTSPRRMLPDFLVIGGKRCGSTSLYQYLIRHPGVRPCRASKGTHYFDVNYQRGWVWYRSKFPVDRRRPRQAGHRPITGEASPYYLDHPLAPFRIARALPGVRLIAVLRDPVERAWSHYRSSVDKGLEDLPIHEALDREPARLAGEVERLAEGDGYDSRPYRHHGYTTRGLYADRLQAIYELFPPERVVILQSEMLSNDPNAALEPALRFLDLEPMVFEALPAYHAATYRPMPDDVRERLRRFYAEPNARLYALPGITFRWDET